MKLYVYFLVLPLLLSACDIFGGGSQFSETCYTNPQPTPSAQLVLESAGTKYVPGRLLISYRGSSELSGNTLNREARGAPSERLVQRELAAAARNVRNQYDLRASGVLGAATGSEIVRTPAGSDVEQLAAQLRRDPRVLYAEPDYYLYPLELTSGTPSRAAPSQITPSQIVSGLPNDPRLGEQWNLLKFGLPAAWQLETGNSDIVLAVLDSGVDLTHEDLVGRSWPGCDVYNQDNDPSPGSPSQLGENQRHGTHVAGIALASGGNGKGIAGVAYTGVKLLPVKVFDNSGGDSQKTATSVVIRAIRWSAGLSVEGMNRNPHPANIINLSLGGKGNGPGGTIESLSEAVQDARNAGSLVIAASGNDYSTNAIFAPANAPGAIAVGSVDEDYRRSEFSNYSTTGRSVDLMAPGGAGQNSCGGILSTFSPAFEGATESAYGCQRGTSMASPFVAGVAALIWSQNPGLTDDEVAARLLSSTLYTPVMNPTEYGAGVVCADRALGAATLCGE